MTALLEVDHLVIGAGASRQTRARMDASSNSVGST